MKKKDVIVLVVLFISFIVFYPLVRDLINDVEEKEQKQENVIYEESEPEPNPYLEKYAGGYTIEVTGISTPDDAVAYVLHKSGDAKWMWLKSDGRGDAKVVSEKFGTWSAEENFITTSITGNSGTIYETYKLVNGRFVNVDNKKRYLKKTR